MSGSDGNSNDSSSSDGSGNSDNVPSEPREPKLSGPLTKINERESIIGNTRHDIGKDKGKKD